MKRLLSIVTRFNHKPNCVSYFFLIFLYILWKRSPPTSEDVYFSEILATVMFVLVLLITPHMHTALTAGWEGDR